MLNFIKKSFTAKISSGHIRIIGYTMSVGIAKLMPTNPLAWLAAGTGIYVTEKVTRARAVEESRTWKHLGEYAVDKFVDALTEPAEPRDAKYQEVKT